jgi:hypothetical protein
VKERVEARRIAPPSQGSQVMLSGTIYRSDSSLKACAFRHKTQPKKIHCPWRTQIHTERTGDLARG